jgi:hypothetical protein
MQYERRPKTEFIVVHTSASAYGADLGWKAIDKMHRERGWDGIGYHGVIRLNGTYEPARPWWAIGAHAYGYNMRAIGFCLVGGLNADGKPHDTYSTTQLNTLELTVRLALLAYPDAKVVGHRDLSPDVNGDGVIEPWEWVKQCPCFDVATWWRRAKRDSDSRLPPHIVRLMDPRFDD